MMMNIETGIRLDLRVQEALDERFESFGPDFVVLPTRARPDGLWYSESDLETVKLARIEGLNVAFLNDESPLVLHEYSAGWQEELSIAVAAGVLSPVLLGLGSILLQKAKLAIARGVHPGPEGDVPFRVTVTRIDERPVGRGLTSVTLEGRHSEVLEGLARAAEQLRLPASETPSPEEVLDPPMMSPEDEGDAGRP